MTTPDVKSEIQLDKDTGQRHFISKLWGAINKNGDNVGEVIISDPIPALGIETLESGHLVVTPINAVAIPYAVPAGCYTLEIAPIIVSTGSWTAFVGSAALRVNTTIATLTDTNNTIIQAGDDPIVIGVNPGDLVFYQGDTDVVANGALRIRALG